MTTTRSKLEAKAAELTRLLESSEQVFRGRIVTELRQTLDELNALDAGTHWTQTRGDTLAKIVTAELNGSRRKGTG